MPMSSTPKGSFETPDKEIPGINQATSATVWQMLAAASTQYADRTITGSSRFDFYSIHEVQGDDMIAGEHFTISVYPKGADMGEEESLASFALVKTESGFQVFNPAKGMEEAGSGQNLTAPTEIDAYLDQIAQGTISTEADTQQADTGSSVNAILKA